MQHLDLPMHRPTYCIMTCQVVLCAVSLTVATGCLVSHGREVIVYTALDREFSEPILAEFTKQTGIRVRAKYDSESTKTVQLTTNILAEQARPRCDLFWNNEIVNTLRLDQLNLLDEYEPKGADAFPQAYHSRKNHWHGFAARARVLLVNTMVFEQANIPSDQLPSSVFDLVDPKWPHKLGVPKPVGIAKPLFGTTATHAVCLF